MGQEADHVGQLVGQEAELEGHQGQFAELVGHFVQHGHALQFYVFEELHVLQTTCCILHRKLFHLCEFFHDGEEQYFV